MKKVGISMPVANEGATIRGFLTEVQEEISGLDYAFTIYVILDDFSKDNTYQIVAEMSSQDNRISPYFYKESTGVVSCYLQGFRLAIAAACDYVIEMDSGGSHPPRTIRDMLQTLDQEEFEVVFMSRFAPGGGIRNMPAYRRFLSWGGTVVANLWLGLSLSDFTSGFQAFQAKVLRAMNLDAFISYGGIYQTEMKYYCAKQGFRIKELPFIYVGTSSSFKPKWIWLALKTLRRLKVNRQYVFKDRAAKHDLR
jgi:dolichol-phosphate mannosyltransferase